MKNKKILHHLKERLVHNHILLLGTSDRLFFFFRQKLQVGEPEQAAVAGQEQLFARQLIAGVVIFLNKKKYI
jgi:hypothetical protein